MSLFAAGLLGLAGCATQEGELQPPDLAPPTTIRGPIAPTLDAAAPPDAAPPDAAPPDAALPLAWSKYTIDAGNHVARVDRAATHQPIQGFTDIGGRDYELRLNESAAYVLTAPTQARDQLDWSKLPGYSDCMTLDLSVNGAMFGWRWQTEVTPPRLEITAYANNDGRHLAIEEGLVSLDLADLAADAPLHYRVWSDGAVYRFSVRGVVRGRTIDADASLPRACPTVDARGIKWGSGLYFGGTSMAPTEVTVHVAEHVFSP